MADTERNLHEGHRERLRQRFLGGGLEGFDDHTALELLLCFAIPRRDVNIIAHRLMDTFGSLHAVLNAPVEELIKVEGIGAGAAALIALVPQIARRGALSLSEAKKHPKLTSSKIAGRFILPYFSGERTEVVYLMTLDNKCRLINCRKISEGELNYANISTRKVVEAAIRDNATSVILAHNHTSGAPLPSQCDIQATEQLQSSLSSVGISLLDHIVVADDDFVSVADAFTTDNDS